MVALQNESALRAPANGAANYLLIPFTYHFMN